ncbi:MAG TPA: hypothetical protein PLU24_04755, partial [Candidatus Omnitrophota bacterium]|nr:hypothetical protein [Candidatus Omnitrophota bacterium]
AMEQERLLMMLITGKSWTGSKTGIKEGELSADMLKEFVDFFILGGSSGEFFKKFGIDGIILKFDQDKQSKGIGIKKDITKNVEVSYTIEQSPNTALNQTQPDLQYSDTVYLKYKNRF